MYDNYSLNICSDGDDGSGGGDGGGDGSGGGGDGSRMGW